ncbi:sialidase family protein [Amycolatopsis taiwanensis]|uniref:sialidase family protein n=1 Tax=Amycolatopsis taiwanensis TaxID=342230 RepID=UPI0004868AA5|nr:sialidase family protein [Amycolatopsis taiwanensis]
MRRPGNCFVLLMSMLLIAGLFTPAEAAERQRLTVGSYPRMVRLQHSSLFAGRIIAAVSSWDARGPVVPVYESTDEGAGFDNIGEIRDPEGAQGECCGTLFELPRRVGHLSAGTLLWAAGYGQNAGPDRRIAIKVWASSDGGRRWSFLSEAVRSANATGVWEPEFTVDAAGTLWIHYADETDEPGFGQVLSRVGTTDGIHWSARQVTLAIPPSNVRPGMPIVRNLPDGRYYFGYEICNYGDRYCDPYYKISQNGTDFGDPGDPGTRVTTASGAYFQHAQTVTVFDDGRLMMVGQIYTDRTGKPLPSNGRVLLANDHSGTGDWYELAAPVAVPDTFDDFCPNYSSALLPVDRGRNVLEMAADYENGACTIYFGKGPV